MDDLISRQALCEYALNQKDKSITPNDIMRFPSAQPVAKDIYVPVKDCISRQVAIDEIKALYEWHDTVTEDRTIDHLKRLPSAQPEVLACGEGELSAQPEIIRCKDCKLHGTNGYRLNCAVFCCTMPDDGFCSCGERREDG